MTTRENDLISLLNEKDALIERLQKELGEARKLNIAQIAEAAKFAREAAIEDCADAADKWYRNEFLIEQDAVGSLADELAKAIRSMDGGGK